MVKYKADAGVMIFGFAQLRRNSTASRSSLATASNCPDALEEQIEAIVLGGGVDTQPRGHGRRHRQGDLSRLALLKDYVDHLKSTVSYTLSRSEDRG